MASSSTAVKTKESSLMEKVSSSNYSEDTLADAEAGIVKPGFSKTAQWDSHSWPKATFSHKGVLGLAYSGWGVKLETMIYSGQITNELFIQKQSNQSCLSNKQHDSRQRSLLFVRISSYNAACNYNDSISEWKTCHVPTNKCPQRVYPWSILTIYWMSNPREWEETEFWNAMFEDWLPESLNDFLRQPSLILIEPACWYSRGSQLVWPRFCPSGSESQIGLVCLHVKKSRISTN